jgi:membrane protease YdiL (CAAX protease family)
MKLKIHAPDFKGKDTLLLLICLISGLLFSLFTVSILNATGVIPGAPDLTLLEAEGPVTHLHILIVLNHLGLFILPVFLFFSWRKELIKQTSGSFSRSGIVPYIYALLIMIGSLGIVFLLFEWNKSLPLPEWASSMEADSEEKIKALLSKTGWSAVFVNILLISILPALGEEFFFRGIIQNIIGATSKNAWTAIIATALIFSAFHMQFEGFIPRVFLGVILGYLYVVSKSIWIPVFAHFINNFVQVSAHYIGKVYQIEQLENDEIQVPWFVGILSAVLVIWLCWRLFLFFDRQILKVPHSNAEY